MAGVWGLACFLGVDERLNSRGMRAPGCSLGHPYIFAVLFAGREIQDGDLLLLDLGCEYYRYARAMHRAKSPSC